MKVVISKAELAKLMLARIREHKSCENVSEVFVDLTDERPEANWNLTVIGVGATDSNEAHRIGEAIYLEFAAKYDLATD